MYIKRKNTKGYIKKSNNMLGNKGFSLVEVLVSVAILAIITIPLLETFFTSAKLEAKTKRTQNATDIAQSVAENFKAYSIDQLKAKYNIEPTTVDGKIVFTNIGDDSKLIEGAEYNYVEGADGEDFFVRVELDKNAYTAENVEAGVAVNDFVLPSMESIYSGNNVQIINEITKNDKNILDVFKNKGVINPVRENIQKSITLNVNTSSDESISNADFNTEYILVVNYTYSYGDVLLEAAYQFDIGKYTLKTSDLKQNVYIIYPPYDLYGADQKASDIISINYNYSGPESKEKPVKIYIAVQEVNSAMFTDKLMKIEKSNVFLNSQAISELQMSLVSEKLVINSNIAGFSALTAGNTTADMLYSMKVMVAYDDVDVLNNTFTEIKTTYQDK